MATLVHHWDFHEGIGTTVADIIGGNDGTITTSSNDTFEESDIKTDGTNIYWVAGRNGGNALYCNGSVSNDYDYVFTSDPIASGGLGAYSLAVWFKQSTEYQGIFIHVESDQKGSRSAAAGNQLGIHYIPDPSDWLVAATNTGGVGGIATYSINVADGNWHLLCAGSDESGNGKLWLDGVLRGTFSSTEFTGSGYWRLFGTKGITGFATSLSMAATIDDAKVFSGLLTDAEVACLYNDQWPCLTVTNALMFSCNT